MQITGEWLLCEDEVTRPVIRGRIRAAAGSWTVVEFLVDTGADRTVLSASILLSLNLPRVDTKEAISGIGGISDSVVVETKLQFQRETGKPVAFIGRFAAVTDPVALDLSILGRDILDLFAVIVDRPSGTVCLLGQRHHYSILQD